MSESDMMKLVGMMEDRAKWLKWEWEAGGDYTHLWTRREETLYWLCKIKDLSPSPELYAPQDRGGEPHDGT